MYTAGLNHGWRGRRDRGRRDRREGRRQRIIRRLLIGADGGTVGGREMMAAIYPRGEI
jgi:hypothetical protein